MSRRRGLPREIRREYISNTIFIPILFSLLGIATFVGHKLDIKLIVDNWELMALIEGIGIVAGFVTIFISHRIAYRGRR